VDDAVLDFKPIQVRFIHITQIYTDENDLAANYPDSTATQRKRNPNQPFIAISFFTKKYEDSSSIP
jgi:hypothetical protein